MANFYRHEINAGHMVIWNTNHSARNALSPSYYEGVVTGLKQAAENPDISAATSVPMNFWEQYGKS